MLISKRCVLRCLNSILNINHIMNIVVNVASCDADLLNILKYLHGFLSTDNDNKIL